MQSLHEMASRLPTTSGVYLFKDGRERVIYVGKAKNLKARVHQYLAGHDSRQMVPVLVRQAKLVEVILTQTEKEALLLENTLIKKYRPRFNVRLRDDSNFLHLRIDIRAPWPRYTLVREIKADGARYFGPYTSAQKARATLAYLQRVFPLRTCSDATLRQKRACLLHQMGRCSAPCIGEIDQDTYRQIAIDSLGLLGGSLRRVTDDLERRMQEASDGLAFEEAARWRDLRNAVRATLEHQTVIDPRRSNVDAWAVARDGARVALAVLPVRDGVMGEPVIRTLEHDVDDDAAFISSALNRWYDDGTDVPRTILLPLLPSDHDALASLLAERCGHRVDLVVPVRGTKARLLETAQENAKSKLTRDHDESTRIAEALARIVQVVGLDAPPYRMECFDNSHLSGTHLVSAMAVFEDGRPSRAAYRRYRIKEAAPGDDYGAMREVLHRRLVRGIREQNLPDLLVIDGGKGQVAVAAAVVGDLGLSLAIVGVSKPRTEHARGDRHATDKLVLPHVKDPIRLPHHDLGLRMLQYLRDETHKTVVEYQRRVRTRRSLTSVLEEIEGVGPARRKALIRTLGSVKAVYHANEETLATVPGVGEAMARQIHAVLHQDTKGAS